MRTRVIAFTGSREFSDEEVVAKVIGGLMADHPFLRVQVGDARGADRLVAEAVRRWGEKPVVEKCHWPPRGSTKQERWKAAHERNGRVVAGAELLIALRAPGPETPGTNDAIDQARALGIPVRVFHEGHWS